MITYYNDDGDDDEWDMFGLSVAQWIEIGSVFRELKPI